MEKLNNKINMESMKYHSMLLTKEFGIPYEESWWYIDDICKKNNLDMSYNDTIIWATLETEKFLHAHEEIWK